MKTNRLFLCLAGFMMLASCSNEKVNGLNRSMEEAFAPVREAEVSAYSGDEDIDVTLGEQIIRRTSVNMDVFHPGDANYPAEFANKIPAPVTEEEKQYVLNYIAENPCAYLKKQQADINHWRAFYVQLIGTHEDVYTIGGQQVKGAQYMKNWVVDNRLIPSYTDPYHGDDELCLNLKLNNTTYQETYANKNNKTRHNEWVMYRIEGYGLYLCFDFATHPKNINYKGDEVYNDWVIKLTPYFDTEEEPEEEPQILANFGEIEVNLALNDEKENGDYVSSHLSIHVRDTTDILVYLPVAQEFYCPADDMAIVAKHDMEYAYQHDATITIAGEEVHLYIEYEEDGITIFTEGINAEVLKYCRQMYQDGLTLEVWNYYNGIDREGLKQALNMSTIEFAPEVGKYKNVILNDRDCTVREYGTEE